MRDRKQRRWWPWIVAGIVVLVLVPLAVVVLPILLHRDQGASNQEDTGREWPTVVTATGDDGRERTLEVTGENGAAVDTTMLEAGEHLVVHGSGYDPARGIYVAICAIPDDPATKPGPCLGGVPDQEQQEVAEGAIQFAPSNWINDDWAWKLFGARAFDDRATGTFTAYLEVAPAAGDGIDCSAVACAIYTRNDHTASGDRVQDLHIPIAYAG